MYQQQQQAWQQNQAVPGGYGQPQFGSGPPGNSGFTPTPYGFGQQPVQYQAPQQQFPQQNYAGSGFAPQHQPQPQQQYGLQQFQQNQWQQQPLAAAPASRLSSAVPPLPPGVPIPKFIHFYDKGKTYYEFTNFFAAPIVDTMGHIWPTSEHFFQAQKFWNTDRRLSELVRLMPSSRKAFDVAREYQSFVDPAWATLRDDSMKEALRLKFTQHNHLFELLKSTEGHYLIEHTENDTYWADGKDGTGRNRLGELLMELRELLLKTGATPLEVKGSGNPCAPLDQAFFATLPLKWSSLVQSKALCVTCKVQPAKPGNTHCASCSTKYVLCKKCGQKPEPGRLYCTRCKTKP
eukprot:TRINITY_DN4292_c0_g1_i1.p2 TRINITY_DN4292_c0_g1~~TRINITY_DN4292_c0_g1_i1.p2  ORF type:complete len:348 (-),score=39.81 TRINITY_DN4292_c0_g1_i1:98-1141(-)